MSELKGLSQTGATPFSLVCRCGENTFELKLIDEILKPQCSNCQLIIDIDVKWIRPIIPQPLAGSAMYTVTVAEDREWQSIEQLEGLSIRSYNVLKRSGINFVQDIVKMSKTELYAIKHMSRFTQNELEEKLGIQFEN